MRFGLRRKRNLDAWSLRPGDLPSERLQRLDPRLRGLENNAVFRLCVWRERTGRSPVQVASRFKAALLIYGIWSVITVTLQLPLWMAGVGYVLLQFVKRPSQLHIHEGWLGPLSMQNAVELSLSGFAPREIAVGLYGAEVSRNRMSRMRFLGHALLAIGWILLLGAETLLYRRSVSAVWGASAIIAILAILGGSIGVGLAPYALDSRIDAVAGPIIRAGEAARLGAGSEASRMMGLATAGCFGFCALVAVAWLGLIAFKLLLDVAAGYPTAMALLNSGTLWAAGITVIGWLIGTLWGSRDSVAAPDRFDGMEEAIEELLEIARVRMFEARGTPHELPPKEPATFPRP